MFRDTHRIYFFSFYLDKFKQAVTHTIEIDEIAILSYSFDTVITIPFYDRSTFDLEKGCLCCDISTSYTKKTFSLPSLYFHYLMAAGLVPRMLLFFGSFQ